MQVEWPIVGKFLKSFSSYQILNFENGLVHLIIMIFVVVLLLFSHSVMSDSVWPHRRQPPGSPIPWILQARTMEWVAISFSNTWKWKVKVKSLSHVQLLATPWTAAHQAPSSMGFSRQSTGVGCHCLLHSPPVFNLFQHQGLFQWVSSSHQVAKLLELQLQHQSFQWIFRTDLL